MAQSKYLTALIKAHFLGDNKTFRQLVLQLSAMEASAGHSKVAQQIRKLLDSDQQNHPVGQHTGRETPVFNNPTHKADLSGLLHASYREERLSDIVLNDATRQSLEHVINEWKNGPLLESHSLHKRSKLLLVGPPGCGKTFSARVLAGELRLPLFVVKLEGLISRFLGETSVHLTNIFNAMNSTPGVYLFDEFDAIGTNRGEKRDVGEVRRVLSTFLLHIENFYGNSLVIAATNYEQLLDEALFRRFDDVIHYPLPDVNEIEKLLEIKLKNFPHEKYSPSKLAKESLGMNYAEITKAIVEAMKSTVLVNDKKVSEKYLLTALKRRKSMSKRRFKK